MKSNISILALGLLVALFSACSPKADQKAEEHHHAGGVGTTTTWAISDADLPNYVFTVHKDTFLNQGGTDSIAYNVVAVGLGEINTNSKTPTTKRSILIIPVDAGGVAVNTTSTGVTIGSSSYNGSDSYQSGLSDILVTLSTANLYTSGGRISDGTSSILIGRVGWMTPGTGGAPGTVVIGFVDQTATQAKKAGKVVAEK